MDVTVVIGTYGDDSWIRLARTAMLSASRFDVPVIHAHADSLHEARNMGLSAVTTEWVCHLDADDELEDDYFSQMEKGTADIRAPRVRYIRPGQRDRLWTPAVAGHNHACTADCLPYGNWLVIGSLVRSEFARSVGGWRDFSWSEDWDLWLRCYLAGATFEMIPAAIYRAHVRRDSRNRGPSQEDRLEAHHAIAEANGIYV